MLLFSTRQDAIHKYLLVEHTEDDVDPKHNACCAYDEDKDIYK